jgi:hypothetical protein
MAEPTSALTFEDLILEVSLKLGMAFYGDDGDQEPQIPEEVHDLFECKRKVNNAIRMFLADAPPAGWRFSRPVAQIDLWASIAVLAARTVSTASYDVDANETTLTFNSSSFVETMERKSLVITTTGTFTIKRYVSATSVVVSGNAAGAAAKTWSITADGNYTLPSTFGGEHCGDITYASGTNQGTIGWTDEGDIRRWRENNESTSGTPFLAAVRIMEDEGDPRRRWELVVYPTPEESYTVEFPYILSFDKLVDLDEVPPVPFGHDETIKAACLAVCEKEKNNALGVDWDYYRDVCLPNSYRVDSNAAPRRLGAYGSRVGIRTFRDRLYQRPTVTFNP